MKRTSNEPYDKWPKIYKSGGRKNIVWENKVHSENYKSGIDIQSVEAYSKEKPAFLFPGHNYLGPGNKSRIEGNTAKPTTSADAIAADHDDDYTTATNKEDIFKADQKAIKNFALDTFKNKSIPSAVGAVGLTGKHLVEKSLNKVIYPNLGELWQIIENIGFGS